VKGERDFFGRNLQAHSMPFEKLCSDQKKAIVFPKRKFALLPESDDRSKEAERNSVANTVISFLSSFMVHVLLLQKRR